MTGEVLDKIQADFYAQGWAVCTGFLSAGEVSALLGRITELGDSLQKAGIGNQQNYQVRTEVRGDLIKWIDPGTEPLFKEIYLDKLDEIKERFNRSFYLGIAKSEHHIAYYPKGTRYEKHVDTFKNSQDRVVSTVLYLNPGWQPGHGGELCLYPPRGPVQKIEPRAGKLVLFESVLPHEVLVCEAPRYSITGWFKRNSVF